MANSRENPAVKSAVSAVSMTSEASSLSSPAPEASSSAAETPPPVPSGTNSISHAHVGASNGSACRSHTGKARGKGVRGKGARGTAATRFITYAAVIAALYLVLTWLSAAFNLSTFLRLSEALCVLVCFTPAAIPGVTLGCFLGNLLIGSAPLDLLFGTLATLLGLCGGYLLRRLPRLVPLPTVLANALIVPWVITVAYGAGGGYFFLAAMVAGGEVVTAWVLGLLLYYSLKKVKR